MARKRAEKKRRWGDRAGGCMDFFSRNGMCMVATLGVCILAVIAFSLLIPLVVEVEKDIEKVVKGIEKGVDPAIDEGTVILGDMGRNAATALRLFEVPLNITEEIEEDVEDVEKALVAAIHDPNEVMVAYNRVAGTTITCADGTTRDFVPPVSAPGVVINPYVQCTVRHATVKSMPLEQHQKNRQALGLAPLDLFSQ